MEATLEAVFSYYKFDRHGSGFCEKPYFLLSHCSHLMFSLWLADQNSDGAIFSKIAKPAAFTTGLDFEAIRNAEHTRRMARADGLETIPRNDPMWFAFWTQTLESLNPLRAVRFHEFSQQVLTYVDHKGLLEQKTSRKSRRALEDLMREDVTGRLLLSSISVLEDLAWSIIRHLATLDPKKHAVSQITGLIGLLGRIRRTIVCEAPARGPFVPRTSRSWRMPFSRAWLHHIRTRGLLDVVPKREGGSIVCHYTWTSDADTKSWFWTVRTSSLRRPYEEELFRTWAHATGEYLHEPSDSSPTTACWVVQTAEADHLESIAREADVLLQALWGHRACRDLAETVHGILRSGKRRWKPGELPWTYVEQLDQVIERLKFICRETQVLGADNTVESVIQQVWPLPVPAGTGQESPRKKHETTDREAASFQGTPASCTPEYASSKERRRPTDDPEPAAGSSQAEEEMDPAPAEESLPQDSAAKPEWVAEVVLDAPDASRDEEPSQSQPAEEPAEPATHAADDSEPKTDSTAGQKERSHVPEIGDPLLRRLWERHHDPDGPIRDKPLLLAELETELGWKRSQVQRAMTDLFGSKPFTKYKVKCMDGTIQSFLCELVQKAETGIADRTLCTSVL